MATYTCTLSQTYKPLVTYTQASCTLSVDSGSNIARVTPITITVPKWPNGRKVFNGYVGGGWMIYSRNGAAFDVPIDDSIPTSAAERWENAADGYLPAALVKIDSSYASEIFFADGTWYVDYECTTPLGSDHPIAIPQKTFYRFIGCYATNSTSGTKYINADGTPTAEFLALAPTDDVTIYAQFELASVKITINSSYGDYDSKTFYQSLTADTDGKYGYYTDSTCAPSSRIYGILRPSRELYAWGGLRSSSSTSGTLYANADGTFTQAFLDRSAKAVTVYGSFWTQVSYKVTVNANGGTAPVTAYYTSKADGGIYADWLMETPELLALPNPTRSTYRFLGYYSSTSGTTKYVDFDGTVQSNLKTRKATTTIYARWQSKTATITLNAGGGTGGGTIYYESSNSAFFDETSATVTTVPVPEYPGNTFLGYFDSHEGGNRIIDASGAISPTYAPSGENTLYAQYTIGKSTIDVDFGDGTGGTGRFYYDHAAAKFYADADLTEEIASVTLPTLRLFNCNGLFTESAGGSTVVSASGSIQPSFVPTDEFVTIYAQYTRRCFEVRVDAGGGAFDILAIFHAPSESTWFSDEMLTDPVTAVGVHPRTGYTFGGCFYGDNQVFGADGTILPAACLAEDYTAVALWTAKTYTLTFNAYPGMPSFASKTVTFDAPIGQLPTAVLAGRLLDGWTIDGLLINSDSIWTFDADKTANANWHDCFGGCTDYFGLETANGPLMLVASNSGARRTVIETTGLGGHLAIQSGDSGTGAFRTCGLLLHPVCTYRIRTAGDVTIRLGKAWAKSGATKSGYMIASAEYATSADGEPLLVVRGAANEGADAVNRWDVTLHVSPDHVAQDPCSAVSGGGELVECKTLITCDPVVPMENGMPCASDVVRGKVVVTATVNEYFGEGAPTARLPFVETNGVPIDECDVDFISHAFQAERSL